METEGGKKRKRERDTQMEREQLLPNLFISQMPIVVGAGLRPKLGSWKLNAHT